jgi:hypothetical protein
LPSGHCRHQHGEIAAPDLGLSLCQLPLCASGLQCRWPRSRMNPRQLTLSFPHRFPLATFPLVKSAWKAELWKAGLCKKHQSPKRDRRGGVTPHKFAHPPLDQFVLPDNTPPKTIRPLPTAVQRTQSVSQPTGGTVVRVGCLNAPIIARVQPVNYS